MQNDVTRAHYDRLADKYNENWAHDANFIRWMTANIIDRLRIGPTHHVLDVGGGAGVYAHELAKHAGAVVCADPSRSMLEQVPSHERLIRLRAGAEGIAENDVRLPHDGYDSILLKEVINHVAEPPGVLEGLSRHLRPGGRILVIMLPADIGYPLFDAALELFRKRQPNPEDIATAMSDRGLRSELTYEEFPLTFDLEHYLRMVQDRHMSLLSDFDNAEIEEDIAEIRRKHPGPELSFPDRFAFILGVKA